MDELIRWLGYEPERHRCSINYLGLDVNYEGPVSLQPNWQVTVWSQREDGTPYKPPVTATGATLDWAAFCALNTYFELKRV